MPYLLTYTIRNAIKLNHKEYVYTQNFWEWLLYMYIQGVPGGNVNILGGHCIGHSKQKKCMCTCGLLWTVSDIELFHFTVAKLLIKRYYVSFLISVFIAFKWKCWYRLPTVHFRKFQSQHQCTLQLVWGHGMLLVCILTFLYAGDNINYETELFVSCIHLHPPIDDSHWFTCFIQWRSAAGVKDNIGRQIQTPVQWKLYLGNRSE